MICVFFDSLCDDVEFVFVDNFDDVFIMVDFMCVYVGDLCVVFL